MAKKSVETMQQARIAIRKGQLAEARQLLRQLVRDDPQNHAAWLLLAKVTSSPEAASDYVKRAESLQPDSLLVQQARVGLEQKESGGGGPSHRYRWRTAVLISGLALLFALIVVGLGPLAWERVSALKGEPMAEAPRVSTLVPTLELASMSEVQPVAATGLMPTPTARPTFTAAEATSAAELRAAELRAVEEVRSQEATRIAIESVPEDPTGLRPAGVRTDERWIDVDLETQTLVAYEGNTEVYNSPISSGTEEFPTVTGQYRTYIKYETQDMNGYLIGYDYYLEDVPYVMYFVGNFAIHGAYWHNNFGVPSSHGCINVNPTDAGWLFEWAPVGTTVNIHE